MIASSNIIMFSLGYYIQGILTELYWLQTCSQGQDMKKREPGNEVVFSDPDL